MIGNLIIRFKKCEEDEVFEGELIVGLDNEANLDEHINSCLENIVAEISGEDIDEVCDLEYYFEEVDNVDESEIVYDWR